MPPQVRSLGSVSASLEAEALSASEADLAATLDWYAADFGGELGAFDAGAPHFPESSVTLAHVFPQSPPPPQPIPLRPPAQRCSLARRRLQPPASRC